MRGSSCWPDVVSGVKKVKADMDDGRIRATLAYGWRSHVIVDRGRGSGRGTAPLVQAR